MRGFSESPDMSPPLSPSWRKGLVGVGLALAAAIAVEFCIRSFVVDSRGMAILYAPVAYAAFRGGLRLGLIAAAIVLFYMANVLRAPDSFWALNPNAGATLLVDALSLSAVVLAIGAPRPIRHERGAGPTAREGFATIGPDGVVLEADERLRESEALSHALQETSDDTIVTIDEQGAVESVNSSVERMFGYEASDVLGGNVSRLMPNPGDGEDGSSLGSDRAAGERGVMGQGGEAVGRRKDGTTFPIKLTVGEFRTRDRLHFTGFIRDDSERERLEATLLSRDTELRGQAERLREQAQVLSRKKELYRSFVAASGQVVWRVDAHGEFVDDPPEWEAYTGMTSDESRGMGWLNAVRSADRERLVESWRSAQESRGRFEAEFVMRIRDGSWRSTWLRAVPILKADGEVREWIGTCIDVTQRKEAERAAADYSEQLRELTRRLFDAQEAERRHLSRELHDQIGQALTALKINLQQARQDNQGDPRLEESVGIVDHTLQQVRDIALDLRPSLLDDLGLVAALEWYVARHAQRTGLDGRFLADPEEINADPEIATACFRVAQEALTNIARHARAKRFSVELLQHAGGLQLVVRDDGVGFDPNRALRAASRGASLGLVGMRERVEHVGGRIVFESEPNGGVEVQVDFPNSPKGLLAATV